MPAIAACQLQQEGGGPYVLTRRWERGALTMSMHARILQLQDKPPISELESTSYYKTSFGVGVTCVVLADAPPPWKEKIAAAVGLEIYFTKSKSAQKYHGAGLRQPP